MSAAMFAPRDAALPQLAIAFDEFAMAGVFDAELRGGGAPIVTACHVDRIKYRPQRNCSVLYQLDLRDAGGHSLTQPVSARFCAGGEAARRYAKANFRPLVASAAGPSLSYFRSLDMLAHWLPNDAKLDALQLLADDTRLAAEFLPEVTDALGTGASPISHDLTIVQYVPEHRVCARVDIQLSDGTQQRVYAKADGERRGADTYAIMRALHVGAAQRAGRLVTPQPLMWQPQAGLHWQAAVAGTALLDQGPQINEHFSALVGAQLAALHATPVPATREVDILQLRDAIDTVITLLLDVEPVWLPTLRRLAEMLKFPTHADTSGASGSATLHGDLHPRNILVHAGKLAFIDLDSVRRGPAVIELGAWIADAMYRALLAGAPVHTAAPAWHAFIRAYADASGFEPNARVLAWATAWNLVCQRASRCVTNLKPGRYAVVPGLLALAEEILRAGSVEAANDSVCEAA